MLAHTTGIENENFENPQNFVFNTRNGVYECAPMTATPGNFTLLEHTHTLLDADLRSTTQLAAASGLPYHWLYQVRKRIIRNPGVTQLEKLHTFLLENAR